jgi:hypothetical protein
VPLLELGGDAMASSVDRARRAGAVVVLDGLSDPVINGMGPPTARGHEIAGRAGGARN